MKHRSSALSAVFALICCCVAICQESKSLPEHDTAKPLADLQSLIKTFSGTWSMRVRFEPSSDTPKGFDGEGEETWRSGPGGFTLIEEERLPSPAGDVYLLGVIWWDQTTKQFRGMECQNLLPYTCDLKGALNDITMSWDGKQFVINEQETHGSKKWLWHEVWAGITPTSFVQTGDVQQADGHSERFFTIHATKITRPSGSQ